MLIRLKSIIIKEAKEADLAKIFDCFQTNPEFIQSMGYEDYTFDQLQLDFHIASISGRTSLVVKDETDLILGALEIMEENPDDDHPWIGYLVIDKNHANEELKDEILKGLINDFFPKKLEILRVSVRESDKDQINFYKRNGFMEIDKQIRRMHDGEISFLILEHKAQ